MATQTTITDITGKQHTLTIRQTSSERYTAHLGDYRVTETSQEAVIQHILSALNHNHPAQFEQETAENQQQLLSWIAANLRPGTRGKAKCYSSYYLKHVAERAIGRYVGNGEMKGALLKAGYVSAKGTQEGDINWNFVLERGLPEKLDPRNENRT